MKTNAILYSRLASIEQLQNGEENSQLKLLREYCKHKSITVKAEYCDAGVASGCGEQFQNMLDKLNHNIEKVNLVLIVQWDRISRNPTKVLELIIKLDKMGIELNSISQTKEELLNFIKKDIVTEQHMDNLLDEVNAILKTKK